MNVQLVPALGVAATSSMADIARHALAILARTAEAAPDAVAQVMQLLKPPSEDTVNTSDTLCAIYAIRTYEAIAMAEPNTVAEHLADAAYMKIVRLAGDSRLRVQLEVHPRRWVWLALTREDAKLIVRVVAPGDGSAADDPSAD